MKANNKDTDLPHWFWNGPNEPADNWWKPRDFDYRNTIILYLLKLIYITEMLDIQQTIDLYHSKTVG